nr:TIGR03746 family integrating conjugative element protein [Alcaligenes faecalis]
MSSKYLNALATVQATNKRLGALVLVVAALGAVGMYFAARTPHRIDVNLHPNIQGGDVVTVTDGQSPVPDVNVYGFAYYIWQQVNRWQADGYKDYGKQIYYYQAYITPSCRAQLENDMNTRDRAGELRSRTRIMTEIPGFGFSPRRVISQGTNTWTVLLDMQLQETFRGQQIKDIYIRYPMRVVRYEVDPEKNPWKLAIDCYGNNRPARLNPDEVAAVQKNNQSPELPTESEIVPATLPGTITDPATNVTDPAPTPIQVRPVQPQSE